MKESNYGDDQLVFAKKILNDRSVRSSLETLRRFTDNQSGIASHLASALKASDFKISPIAESFSSSISRANLSGIPANASIFRISSSLMDLIGPGSLEFFRGLHFSHSAMIRDFQKAGLPDNIAVHPQGQMVLDSLETNGSLSARLFNYGGPGSESPEIWEGENDQDLDGELLLGRLKQIDPILAMQVTGARGAEVSANPESMRHMAVSYRQCLDLIIFQKLTNPEDVANYKQILKERSDRKVALRIIAGKISDDLVQIIDLDPIHPFIHYLGRIVHGKESEINLRLLRLKAEYYIRLILDTNQLARNLEQEKDG